MKLNRIIISCSLIILPMIGFSQPTSINVKKDPYKWMFGLGWNVVNDNEEKLPNLIDVGGSWNYLYYPTRLTIDKYGKWGWSYEGALAYNRYTSSKIVNDSTGRVGSFASGDFAVKYSFWRFMKGARRFDPYLSAGLGLTYRQPFPTPLVLNGNLSAGFNYFFLRRWGLNFQITGKLAVVPDIYVSRYDYFQYSLGLVYKKQPSKSPDHFNKRKHKWAHEKVKFKRRNT
jgi:hypothetical protein